MTTMFDSHVQSSNAPTTRKTRFVCISDTHNGTANGSFKLPKGDVLIHAGDLTNQGSYTELKKTIKWIEEADFEAKIVVAGNHDITLDSNFYDDHGPHFHNQNPQVPADCQQLLDESASILWLKHEDVTVSLRSPTGPRTTFKIFGSPYSPAHDVWAFGYTPEEAIHIWDCIPLDTDVVVTHTPAKYHCDERKDHRAVGCDALRETLWRVRPRLAVCGHVHEGRGAERVYWDLNASNIKYRESGIIQWEDPGKDNKKMSIIDLTRKGGNPLKNDGSAGDWTGEDSTGSSSRFSYSTVSVVRSSLSPQPNSISDLRTVPAHHVDANANPQLLPKASRGQGGVPPSQRCDLEALSGRLGREETMIINAAMMASSWPHSAGGGKKFNKPIVVDIDLPVWEK